MREEDKFVDIAISCLEEALGLRAKRIPESAAKTPDIFASDDASTYLIEVKVKNENANDVEVRSRALREGGEHSSVKETGYMSAYNSVIEGAVEQLREYEAQEDHFRLIWLEYTGPEQQLMDMRSRGTLYGIVQVVELSTRRSFPCLFFDYSAFYRNRHVLDAAILTFGGKGTLCINPLSPRASKFKNTKLYSGFGSDVFDPDVSEKKGEILIVDADFPRSNEAMTLEYIRKKYQLSIIVPLRLKQFSAEVMVPKGNQRSNTENRFP